MHFLTALDDKSSSGNSSMVLSCNNVTVFKPTNACAVMTGTMCTCKHFAVASRFNKDDNCEYSSVNAAVRSKSVVDPARAVGHGIRLDH